MGSPVQLNFTCLTEDANYIRHCSINNLIIAGWTGRDKGAMEAHIKELEALGVARPASTPIFYRVAGSRLTTADSIQVSGESSSGEVEFVLTNIEGELWVGVGSDHTDRADLLKCYREHHGTALQPGDVMFGGTLAAIGEIRPAQRFEFELEDPVLNRKISHGYDTEELSISG